MVLLLLPPLTVDNADVYPQMSTGLLVLGHHNISAVHYRKVWKKMFPFLEEIERKNISMSSRIRGKHYWYCQCITSFHYCDAINRS